MKKLLLGLLSITLFMSASGNSVASVPSVVINEILPNPTGKDSGNEWIELHNTSTSAINLNGYTVEDATGKPKTLSGSVAAKGFLVITSPVSLNNDGDTIIIKNKNGAQKLIYGKSKEGYSYAQNGSDWVFTATPTPGKVNKFAAPEPLATGSSANNETAITAATSMIQGGEPRKITIRSGDGRGSNLKIAGYTLLAAVIMFIAMYVLQYKKGWRLGKRDADFEE